MTNSSLPHILFITICHQYNNFLIWHNEYGRKNLLFNSNFLLIDQNINSSKTKRNSPLFFLILYLKFIKRLNLDGNINLIVTSHPLCGLFLAIYSIANRNFSVNWVHWFTGQVWSTQKGIKRHLYKSLDKLICKNATHIFCDSLAQVNFLNSNGFNDFNNISSPGFGSINGVSEILFNDLPKNIDKNNIRLGYVGRINRDKGIIELINEFSNSISNNFTLEIYGEIDDPKLESEFLELVLKDPRINFYGDVLDKRLIYSNIDVLIQPSFREGFSNVLIEAQAQSIPVVVRDIYGVKDAYQNGTTGFTFKKDCEIFDCIKLITDNESNFKLFQKQARNFASNFLSDIVLRKISISYLKIIND